MKHLLIFLFLCLSSSLAVEQSTENIRDGNHLLRRCQASIAVTDRGSWKDEHEAFDAGFCHGLIEGVTYYASSVCLTDGVTGNQMARVVIKFLEDNPENLNADESMLVKAALTKAFPCKSK